MNSSKVESDWQKMKYANLVRYNPSGVFFARGKVAGKPIRRSLKTKSQTVAKTRLDDLMRQERMAAQLRQGATAGKLTAGEALRMYRERKQGDHSLKPRTKKYYEERTTALLKSWPDLARQDVGKLSKTQCLAWSADFGKQYSANAFNHTVSILKEMFEIGKELGARYDNPADSIKWIAIKPKMLRLPSSAEFAALVDSVRHAGGGFSRHCADLILFLAYGGFRKGEASNVLWRDVQMQPNGEGNIHVRGDEQTGTKNSEERLVPIIPEMYQLLQRLLAEVGQPNPNSPVMQVKECQKAIDRAVNEIQIKRFTHHDLRHLFATRCIESNVDIPTVSRWLGHKDGGALAMRTYGHLRQEHSMSMASKVQFNTSLPNPKTAPAILASSPLEKSVNVLGRDENAPEFLASTQSALVDLAAN